jgi:hypothetical protein
MMAGPWEDYAPAANSGPWEDYGDKKPAEKVSSIADFFKSMPTKFVEGLAGTIASSGQAEESLQTGGQGFGGSQAGMQVPGPEQSAQIMGAGSMHQPQGPWGRYGGAIAGAFGNPLSIINPLGAIGGAVGGQAAAELSPNSPIAPFIGGVLGGSVPGLVRGGAASIARAQPRLTNDPVRMQFNQELGRQGVTPSAGEFLGSKGIQEIERFGSLPGGKQSYTNMKANTEAQLTKAVFSKMGENTDVAAPKIWEDSQKRIGKMYEDSIAKMEIQFNAPFRDAVNDLKVQAIARSDTNETTAAVHKILNRLIPGKSPGALWSKLPSGTSVMDGRSFQNLTSSESAIQSLIDAGGVRKYFGTQIKKLLNSEIERAAVTPEQKEALAQFKEANRQFFVRKVAIKAMGDDTARLGHIDARKLASALDKEELEAGTTDLHRLANAAVKILEPNKPLGYGGAHESGGRGMIAQAARAAPSALAAAGGYAGSHFGPAGAVAGAALGYIAPGKVGKWINSKVGQNYLKGDLPFQKYLQKRGLLQPKESNFPSRAVVGGVVGGQAAQKNQLYEE